MKKIVTLPALGVLCIAFSCSENKEITSQESYPVIKPIIKDTLMQSTYVADIQAHQFVEIRARVNGYLEKIHIEEGSFVKKGQLLFSISSQIYSQAVRTAQAMLNTAQTELKIFEQEFQNINLLFEKNIVSKAELEIAQLKVQSAEAKLEESKSNLAKAEIELSFAEIRAPFDGYINRFNLKAGSLISEGDLLTSLTDNSQIFAYFNVSEKDYFNYINSDSSHQLKQVNLVLADNSLFAQNGMIETTDCMVDQNTGCIGFRARFNNPDYKIKHGASAKIVVYKKYENAVIIPQKSTFEIQDKNFVYIINDQNEIELRRINIVHRLSRFFIVNDGIKPDDIILYEGIQLVREGDKIKFELLTSSQVLSEAHSQFN